MQVLFLGRAPRTKETLPDFLKWRRVTRPPLVFRGLTDSQRTLWRLLGSPCLPAIPACAIATAVIPIAPAKAYSSNTGGV